MLKFVSVGVDLLRILAPFGLQCMIIKIAFVLIGLESLVVFGISALLSPLIRENDANFFSGLEA